MQFKRLLFSVLLLMIGISTYAEWKQGSSKNLQPCKYRHNVSLVLADPIWETAMWYGHSTLVYDSYANPNFTFVDKNRYRYTPHIGVEYMYNFTRVVSFGGLVDIQATMWDQNEFRAGTKTTNYGMFYNLTIIPTVRFTYFRRGLFELHSSIGVGMNINGGTEEFYKGGKTVVAPAIDFGVVGVSVGKDHWYGTLDLGGTYSLLDKSAIFMLGARMIRAGVTYRF